MGWGWVLRVLLGREVLRTGEVLRSGGRNQGEGLENGVYWGLFFFGMAIPGKDVFHHSFPYLP